MKLVSYMHKVMNCSSSFVYKLKIEREKLIRKIYRLTYMFCKVEKCTNLTKSC